MAKGPRIVPPELNAPGRIPKRDSAKSTNPETVRAAGFQYLLRYLQGHTIAAITREFGVSRPTVTQRMKKAAIGLVDQAQATLLADVFPKMVKLLTAAMDQEIKKAEEGKPIDTALVERLMKGLYVTDAPQLKAELVHQTDADVQVTSLEGYMVKKTIQSKPPEQLPASIDVEVVKDAESD